MGPVPKGKSNGSRLTLSDYDSRSRITSRSGTTVSQFSAMLFICHDTYDTRTRLLYDAEYWMSRSGDGHWKSVGESSLSESAATRRLCAHVCPHNITCLLFSDADRRRAARLASRRRQPPSPAVASSGEGHSSSFMSINNDAFIAGLGELALSQRQR